MNEKDFKRFAAKLNVSAEGECLLWAGGINTDGYGVFHLRGKTVRAHRAAYEHWKMPIPTGLQIDHLCRVRDCVNPDHLEPVTQSENALRGDVGAAWAKIQLGKTQCPRGHAYSEENTYRPARGERQCRACRRAHTEAYQKRKRESQS